MMSEDPIFDLMMVRRFANIFADLDQINIYKDQENIVKSAFKRDDDEERIVWN